MTNQRFTYAAAAVSLATAAPLFAQDSTAHDSTSRSVSHHEAAVVLDSSALRRLPIDGVLDIPVLVPGFYSLTDPRRFSARGGFSGDPAIYVDGALIRNGQRQNSELLPPLRGIRSLAITTGLGPADRGDLRLGLLDIETPSGPRAWTGALAGRGDRLGNKESPFALWRNVGFMRLEATGGGPLPGGFTIFAALQADGQESLEAEKLRDVQAPVYVAGATDTIVRQPIDFGDPASDTIDVAIPRFVQYSRLLQRVA